MPEIRRMTLTELKRQVLWAQKEGWEPGKDDAELFWNLDPEGFLAIEEGGRHVGGGAVIRHDGNFGFMGLFIMDPNHRGKGWGKKLWIARRDYLLGRLSANATIGLDGVYEMVPFYEKGGFKSFTHHRRFRLDQPSAGAFIGNTICSLELDELAELADFDACCFPTRREGFLFNWTSQSSAIAYGVKNSQGLKGFGVMRGCPSGWRIGPLFAETRDDAEALFLAFQTHQSNLPIFLDSPDNNPESRKMCCQFGMKETFGCIRMYLGAPPSMDHSRIFGVTTLEVG